MKKFILARRNKKDYTPFTCRIEKELLNKARDIVIENNLKSMNQFMNDCIRFSIKNIKIEK